jgi:transposase
MRPQRAASLPQNHHAFRLLQPRRKPLPAHLPRQSIEYDLSESEKVCPCCAHPQHRMGEELGEQRHIEVKASALQHMRFKYACRHCERHA